MTTLKSSITAVAAMLAFANIGLAQLELPGGTKISCRLEQTLSSATAEEGQSVTLAATESIKVNNVVVVPQGATVVGTVVQAVPKRRMGRTGKLDFSIDKVRAADGEYIPLRYTMQKKEGGSHGMRAGVITAGVAVAFWPAAPLFLLMRGKDVTINRGVVFDVSTDQGHTIGSTASAPAPSYQGMPASPGAVPTLQFASNSLTQTPAISASPAASTAVSITADVPGAEIEVDGVFVGSTPSTVTLAAGPHRITVRNGAQAWQRAIQIQGGGSLNVNALFKAK